MIPKRHQDMLLNIIDLEKVTVEDIMVPRKEIAGINLEDDWETSVRQITNSQYTRLPVFRDNIDHVIGFIHLRKLLPLLKKDKLDEKMLENLIREPLFIPENTPLNRQLLNFQQMFWTGR